MWCCNRSNEWPPINVLPPALPLVHKQAITVAPTSPITPQHFNLKHTNLMLQKDWSLDFAFLCIQFCLITCSYSVHVKAFVGRNYVFEDSNLLGYDAVSNGTQLRMFRWRFLAPSSRSNYSKFSLNTLTLKMQASSSSGLMCILCTNQHTFICQTLWIFIITLVQTSNLTTVSDYCHKIPTHMVHIVTK
jgi:hypothetical protein